MTYPDFCERAIRILSDIRSIGLTNISDRLPTSRRSVPRLSDPAASPSRPFVSLSHVSAPFPFTVRSARFSNRLRLPRRSFRRLVPSFPTLDSLSDLAVASNHARLLAPGPRQVPSRSPMPAFHPFELCLSFPAAFSLSASISSVPFSVRSQMIASTCSVVRT